MCVVCVFVCVLRRAHRNRCTSRRRFIAADRCQLTQFSPANASIQANSVLFGHLTWLPHHISARTCTLTIKRCLTCVRCLWHTTQITCAIAATLWHATPLHADDHCTYVEPIFVFINLVSTLSQICRLHLRISISLPLPIVSIFTNNKNEATTTTSWHIKEKCATLSIYGK